MKNTLKKITTTSALALTATIVTGIAPPPASAQVIEILSLAGSALNSLTGKKKPQQPQYQQYFNPAQQSQAPVNRTWTIGTNNLNGNNLNLCVLTCTPNTNQAPNRVSVPPQRVPVGVRPGVPVPPQAVPAGVRPGVPGTVVQQNQQIMRNGVPVNPQGLPPGVRPGVPGGVVQQNQQVVRNGVPVPPQAVPTGVRPGTPVPPQARPQPAAPRPTIIIPPIKLPISLPL